MNSVSLFRDSGFIQVRQNLMAKGNASTIDLTDEDDPKPQRIAQGNPPALVALRNRQQAAQSIPVQRQLLATQQHIRNAALATQNRKLPMIGKCLDVHIRQFC